MCAIRRVGHKPRSSVSRGRRGSRYREQLPAVGVEVEDEVDEPAVRTLVVLYLGDQHRLLHAVARHLAGGKANFLGLGQQLAVRARARAVGQIDGRADTRRVKQSAVEAATLLKLLFDVGTIGVLLV